LREASQHQEKKGMYKPKGYTSLSAYLVVNGADRTILS
jgi:hypothetical protein